MAREPIQQAGAPFRRAVAALLRYRSVPSWLAITALAAIAPAVFAQVQSAAPQEDVERGRQLYLELHCGACHRLPSVGAAGFFGPPHDAMGVIAGARLAGPDYAGRAEDAAGYLRESIVEPAAYIVPGFAFTRHPMPAYDLAPADLDALVAFLLAQDGSATSQP